MALTKKQKAKYSNKRPYFDANATEGSRHRYVAWIDLMGAGATLEVSHQKAMIFIGKLHDAVLTSKSEYEFETECYPFVDGVYITADTVAPLLAQVKAIYKMMALSFVLEKQNSFRSLIRGSISLGEVIEGRAIVNGANSFKQDLDYTKGILLGAPVARAYLAERKAAPFGVWIDEPARQFQLPGSFPIRQTFWKWWEFDTQTEGLDEDCHNIFEELVKCLPSYFDWCDENSNALMYEKSAILRHRALASEYFGS